MDEERSPLLAGRYRIVERLGSGGMGVVWRAVDELLDREVAAKEVRAPEHMREADVRLLYARLKQEARAAARISHPYVITVHDVVEQQGRPWIVMELVRGKSLADVLEEEGVLQPKEAARIGAMVLQALRSAHAAGVLHRDVKPANVLIEESGRVVLTDFGIAVVEGSGTLTHTGDIVGSPDFLAPERAMGQRPGTPSDLWSLGTTLYAAIEGLSPFRRTSALSTLQAVVQDEAPTPRRAGPLTPLLEGLLRKDPRDRMGAVEAQRLLDSVAAGRLTEPPGWARSDTGEYVRTAVAAPSPAPVPRPAPSPVPSPVPAPGPPVRHLSPAPPGPHLGGVFGPPTPPQPERPFLGPQRPNRPTGRRKSMVILGPVLAFLLAGGAATAAVIATRDDGGTPSGGTGGTVAETSRPSDGTSGGQPQPRPSTTPGPQETPAATTPITEPTRNPGTTCAPGGWVPTCGYG
ncbi:serine/threonine-protein kinase [Streptomyces syringium]|uniref:serine/threonine-protein kinase n=1 Tax=Streptomyces syringium TaxID=76729 RepID=UPI003425CA15